MPGAPAPALASRWQSSERVVLGLQREPDLFEVIGALDPPRRLTRCLNRRQQQSYQQTDHCNHHEQLDDGEASASHFFESLHSRSSKAPRDRSAPGPMHSDDLSDARVEQETLRRCCAGVLPMVFALAIATSSTSQDALRPVAPPPWELAPNQESPARTNAFDCEVRNYITRPLPLSSPKRQAWASELDGCIQDGAPGQGRLQRS